MEHTPTPFAPRVIKGMFEKAFGFAPVEDEFICRAVNTHEALLGAAIEMLEVYRDDLKVSGKIMKGWEDAIALAEGKQ